MKKLGIGKKDKSGGGLDPSSASEDSKRSHLFGGRNKNKSPAAQAANPYAVPQGGPSAPDPYAARPAPSIASGASTYGGMGSPAYPDSGRASIATQPPPYEKASYGAPPPRGGPSPKPYGGPGGPPGGGYGAPPPQQAPRYGNQGYGNMSGYGADPYGSSKPSGSDPYGSGKAPGPGPSSTRPGGYGGMGGAPDDPAVSERRNELFGGARERLEEKQKQEVPPDQGQSGTTYGSGGASGVPDSLEGGYGTYQDRELTAEEQEEEDVNATKDEIRALKREDVSATRNALRIAAQAEETGRATLERLAAQGERIHNTEKNLDLASSQNRLAEEKARELKHLNRSMFAPNVQNPFTKQRRLAEKEQAILETHQSERNRRDATRQAAWSSTARQAELQRNMGGVGANGQPKRSNLAERSKYQFEADSDDERMEDEIDQNLDMLSGAVGRMNMLGKAMGKEVDAQNTHIDRIIGKTDQVDDQIAMNRARLDRIK